MAKRLFAAAVAATTLTALITAGSSAADARPMGPDRPNGLTTTQTQRAVDAPFGDCAATGVTCKPQDQSGTCTGYTSQTTPPASIRVYDPSYTADPNHIRVVPFLTYVENVLPNEWLDSWDGDALKAGAVAITSYAWYWVTQRYGGYVGTATSSTCFDVTADQNFQVYQANSAQDNSTAKVLQVFPNAIRVNGVVLQASYFSSLHSNYNPDNPATYDACGEGADGSFLSQSGSQTCNEDNTGNKWPVILKLYYGQNIELATPAQLSTPHDFQYLHRSTPAVFNNGSWTIADGYPTVFTFGGANQIPVVNTVGDGFARIGVYNPPSSTFYLGSPTGNVTAKVRFGNGGDIPVAAQYQGLSSPTQLAVFRPGNGTWYFAQAATSGTAPVASTISYGAKGDVPIPADYNGDGRSDVAVYRPSNSTFYIAGSAAVKYGSPGDIPAPADYDGDGKAQIAVYRPSNSTFYIAGRAAVQYGSPGDIPVTGDFTGDGKDDIAIYRPKNHMLYVAGQPGIVLPAAGTPIGAAPYHF